MSNLIDVIKQEINIIDYAKQCGYHPKKVGNNEYTLREHDSIRINPLKNIWIRNSSGEGGSVIDFCMFANSCSMSKAIKLLRVDLHNYDNKKNIKSQPKPQQSPKHITLHLPDKNKNSNRVYGYLCGKRGIDGDVVNSLIKRSMLYEDSNYHRCVWVGYDYDGKAKFGCQRTTLSKEFLSSSNFNQINKPFVRGDLRGSKKEIGFYIDNKANDLFVTEAPIDAMSIMTILKLHKMDYKKFNYLAQSGTNGIDSLIYHIKHQPLINRIYLCYDNDEAGENARIIARSRLMESGYTGKIIDKIPINNDFNDDLIVLLEGIKKNQNLIKKQEEIKNEISY